MPPHLLPPGRGEGYLSPSRKRGSATGPDAWPEQLPLPGMTPFPDAFGTPLSVHLFGESPQLPPRPPTPWGRQKAPFLTQSSRSTGPRPVWWHHTVSRGRVLSRTCLSVLPGQEPQQEQERCLTRPASCPKSLGKGLAFGGHSVSAREMELEQSRTCNGETEQQTRLHLDQRGDWVEPRAGPSSAGRPVRLCVPTRPPPSIRPSPRGRASVLGQAPDVCWEAAGSGHAALHPGASRARGLPTLASLCELRLQDPVG